MSALTVTPAVNPAVNSAVETALAVAPAPAATVFTAEVVETCGLLARIAVQLNPYDVRELALSLDERTLRIVVAGAGFDAGRVAARLDKVIGVLEVSYSSV
ncbi:hypothetical protein [Kribbella sp. NPDC055071]